MAKLRESYGVGAMVPPVVTPGPLASASQQTPQVYITPLRISAYSGNTQTVCSTCSI